MNVIFCVITLAALMTSCSARLTSGNSAKQKADSVVGVVHAVVSYFCIVSYAGSSKIYVVVFVRSELTTYPIFYTPCEFVPFRIMCLHSISKVLIPLTIVVVINVSDSVIDNGNNTLHGLLQTTPSCGSKLDKAGLCLFENNVSSY